MRRKLELRVPSGLTTDIEGRRDAGLGMDHEYMERARKEELFTSLYTTTNSPPPPK